MKPIPYNPKVSYFAFTNFRREGKRFGIYQEDRLLHTYILGKTGTGKTNLLISLILQDIKAQRGICVFDVHGDLTKTILRHIPEHQNPRLLHLNLSDPNLKYRYNPIRKVPERYHTLVVASLIDTFQKLWGKQSWGMKMEHILRYILLTLLKQDQATLADISRIIYDENYRKQATENLSQKELQAFWKFEFEKYSKNDLLPILNKIGAWVAYPTIRKFCIENPQDISFRECMDGQKIILINLSKGEVGSDVAHLVGSLLLNALMHAGFSRVSLAEKKRKSFHLFLDEFQHYSNESIINLLSEIRKWKLSLTLAHQYLYQLDPKIREAVLGNVGTMICFRLGQADARFMEKEMYPTFKAIDFLNLENHDIYLKLMIGGKPSIPFSASTFKYTYILTLPT